ncbi:MAG TPA: LytTR family DNA-binding domain-containing protein [Chitinophagaceae bacterium]|nr:LytTR family DNA-binding domain-containing protein [Chitinophagaceae bacterium]
MKFKCVILDDEPMARSFLERYCAKTPGLELVGSFSNAEEAFEYIRQNEIDILFLDVEMPGDNGFQLLDKLMYMPKVILTTSKTEYAFDAFEYHVIDFLKKPITYNRFLKSLEKATKSSDNIAVAGKPKENDFFIKAEGKLIRLNFDDILYIESVGDYVKYFTASKNYLTHSTLKSVEEKMGPHQFMKVHRSYIVNLRKIKDIQDNSVVVEGKVIPISKSLKAGVMHKLNVV